MPMFLPLIWWGLSSKTQKLRLAMNKPNPNPAKKTAARIRLKLIEDPVKKYPPLIMSNAVHATTRKENLFLIRE